MYKGRLLGTNLGGAACCGDDGPVDGPGGGPGDGPVDGPGDGPGNGCESVADSAKGEVGVAGLLGIGEIKFSSIEGSPCC